MGTSNGCVSGESQTIDASSLGSDFGLPYPSMNPHATVVQAGWYSGAECALHSGAPYLEMFVALHFATLYKVKLGGAEERLPFMQNIVTILHQVSTQCMCKTFNSTGRLDTCGRAPAQPGIFCGNPHEVSLQKLDDGGHADCGCV